MLDKIIDIITAILPFFGGRKKRQQMMQDVKEFSELVKEQYGFLMKQLEKVLKDYFDLSGIFRDGRDRTYPTHVNTHENRTPGTQQNYPTKPHNRPCPEHHKKLIGRGAPHGKGRDHPSRRVQPFAVQISVRFYLDIRYKIPNFDSVTKSNKTDLWKRSQEKRPGKVEPEKVPEERLCPACTPRP